MYTINFGATKRLVEHVVVIKKSCRNKIGARIKHNQGASYYVKPLRYC